MSSTSESAAGEDSSHLIVTRLVSSSCFEALFLKKMELLKKIYCLIEVGYAGQVYSCVRCNILFSTATLVS